MKKEVRFKCPLCGNEWVEEQDTEDDWFGLAATQTLCEECSRKAVKQSSKTKEFIFEMLDLFYANKWMYKKLKARKHK